MAPEAAAFVLSFIEASTSSPDTCFSKAKKKLFLLVKLTSPAFTRQSVL